MGGRLKKYLNAFLIVFFIVVVVTMHTVSAVSSTKKPLPDELSRLKSIVNTDFPMGFDNQGCIPPQCGDPNEPLLPIIGQSFIAKTPIIFGVQFFFAGESPELCNNFFGHFVGGDLVLVEFDTGKEVARTPIEAGMYSGPTDLLFNKPAKTKQGKKYIIGIEAMKVKRFGWLLTDVDPEPPACTTAESTYPDGGQAWLENGKLKDTERDFHFIIYGVGKPSFFSRILGFFSFFRS